MFDTWVILGPSPSVWHFFTFGANFSHQISLTSQKAASQAHLLSKRKITKMINVLGFGTCKYQNSNLTSCLVGMMNRYLYWLCTDWHAHHWYIYRKDVIITKCAHGDTYQRKRETRIGLGYSALQCYLDVFAQCCVFNKNNNRASQNEWRLALCVDPGVKDSPHMTHGNFPESLLSS